MLRQVEWGVQNEHITKNRVLSVTTSFFRKFSVSLRTSYKESIFDGPTTQMFIFILLESVEGLI